MLLPLVPEEGTVAAIRVLGPEHPRPEPTADPLWSPQHLAALLNALLYLLLGNDAKVRRGEAEALEAAARLHTPGVERFLPMTRARGARARRRQVCLERRAARGSERLAPARPPDAAVRPLPDQRLFGWGRDQAEEAVAQLGRLGDVVTPGESVR